jgi:hypothetical protein
MMARFKHLWGIETCPTCEGSGFAYCDQCEHACEHDRACPTCKGYEQVPVRIEGMGLVAVAMGVGGTFYPTRRFAQEAIQQEKDGKTILIRVG